MVNGTIRTHEASCRIMEDPRASCCAHHEIDGKEAGMGGAGMGWGAGSEWWGRRGLQRGMSGRAGVKTSGVGGRGGGGAAWVEVGKVRWRRRGGF